MSTTEAILEKVSALPPEKQAEVLSFVESLSKPETPKTGDPYAWLKIAREMNLEGPPDWSRRFEEYLNEEQGGTRR
jgi:hypothetical protein